MRIITLIENTCGREDCAHEHGLSIYIETGKHKILLDTGATDAFIGNARKLGVPLEQVDIVVLSHGHYDHVGGLLTFCELNKTAQIYMQQKACGDFYHGERYIGIDKDIVKNPQVHFLQGDHVIDEELSIFTNITGRKFYPTSNLALSEVVNGECVQDSFRHEQCLVIHVDNRRILLSGCAHNGILNILDRYQELYPDIPSLVISGFHMMKKEEYTDEEIKVICDTAQELKKWKTIFYSGHYLKGNENSPMKTNDRIMTFEKICNARDMGGLRTAQGNMISSGLLIRSANLSEATEADKKVLRGNYHLSKIIDLRTGTERNQMPDASIEAVEYLSIPIFDSSVMGISHEKMSSYEQIFAVMPKMEQLYGTMVTDPSCRENLGTAARSVMEHDFSKGSVLWHCTEGKDRCGLLSAVLLLALGVERSTIMEDYLLTNRVNAAKSERYYQMMLSAGKSETEAETIQDIFLAKEEYLDAAFSSIDAQYENTGAFLRDGLNIPQNLIERFQSSVL